MKFVCDDITVLHGDCTSLLGSVLPHCTLITDPPFTMMNDAHLQSMLAALPYEPSDVLVLTNPLSGYIHRGQFTIVPELSTAATEFHRHQRPLDVMTRLVALTEGTVVDPYCGSGTTLLAAHSLGRASIGIELDRQSFERCCQLIETTTGYGGQISEVVCF
jgi:hypothetical protein